ncbi:MAG: hypothetical protein AAGC67_06800 [Myxococcota bacterium]
MLEAAGIPILSDDARVADEDNPRGYYELAAVKRLKEDARFLEGAVGRAVKVVAPLVASLPEGPAYRIVFMERDLEEVLASQHAMMARRGSVDGAPDDAMRLAFRDLLERVTGQLVARPDVEIRFFAHAMLLRLPELVAERMADFIGGIEPDRVAAMAACVEAPLHRRRRHPA